MVSILVIFLAILAVYFFWKLPLVLILVIILISLLKKRFAPIKKEALMFIIIAVIGAGAESVIMLGGSWSYATKSIINFPIWLPFLWGLAGITGITLYQGISED